MSISVELGNARVLHVTHSSDALNPVGNDPDRFTSSEHLEDRHQQSAFLAHPILQEPSTLQHEEQTALHSIGQLGKSPSLQGQVNQFVLEGLSPEGVVGGQSQHSLHEGDRGDGVVQSRDVQHVRDLLDSLTRLRQLQRIDSIQRQLCRGKLSSTKLVLQSYHIDVVKGAIIVPNLQEDQADLSCVLLKLIKRLGESGQRKSHVSISCRAEPLIAIDLNLLVTLSGSGLGPSGSTDITATFFLSHPLTTSPKGIRISTSETIVGLVKLLGPKLSVFLEVTQSVGCSISHGQRARIHPRTRVEEVQFYDLVESTEAAIGCVGKSNKPVDGCLLLEEAPSFGGVDLVDPVAVSIVSLEDRFAMLCIKGHRKILRTRYFGSELRQILFNGLDILLDLIRRNASMLGRPYDLVSKSLHEESVFSELVPDPRRINTTVDLLSQVSLEVRLVHADIELL